MAPRYRWGDFLVDLDTYRLERAGSPLPLEPKAFNLLVLLVGRPGHLFTKQEIFDAVWPGTAVTDHALTRVVAQIRRVLGDDVRDARYLETVPTRGYRWICPVEDVAVTTPSASPAVDPPASPAPRVVRWMASTPWLASALTLLMVTVAVVIWTKRVGPLGGPGIPTAVASAVLAAHAPAGMNGIPWPVQVTTYAGLDMQPAMSRQGDAIAFTSDRSGAFEIYVRALDGSATESQLTRDDGHNVQPAWSPDGRLIAYHSDRRGGIWVVPARGGVPRQIAASGANPAWSPDGRRLAFQSDEHADVAPNGFGAQLGSTIRIVDADGSNAVALTESGKPIGGHASPAWSCDGRYVAFSVFEGGPDSGVWIANVSSGQAALFERGRSLYEAAFAPDDSAVYIAGGEAMIVRVPFDPATGRSRGAREVIPVPGVTGVRGITVSADGKRIGFAGVSLSSQVWAQKVDREGTGTGAPFALTSDTSRRNSLPAVSPDGAKVAYMSTRRGELPNVWVMDADGRNPVQVTSDQTAEYRPLWFPDGKRVAYPSNRGDSLGIWVVDISTRREELLFDASKAQQVVKGSLPIDARLAELSLSPSMERIAFSLIVPPAGRRVLYVSGLASPAPRALTDGTISAGYPSWSPDERRIAVQIRDGTSTQAGIVDVQTGAIRRLTDERGQTWVRSWSPDGRKIAVAALRDRIWNLRWIDVESGREGSITQPGPPREFVRYPAWSPRGDFVVYEHGEMRGNIWTLALR